MENDEPERAAAAYRQAIDTRHAQAAPMAMLCLGEIREEQGDLDTAAELYLQAADSRHVNVAPKAAVNLGEVRLTRDDREGALTSAVQSR